MKICDVVLNSVWYDPRVRKQIAEYIRCGEEVIAIGFKDSRYDEEKCKAIPCPAILADVPSQSSRSPLKRIMRAYLRTRRIRKAILQCKPDLIHANDLNALTVVYPVARRLRAKLVYDSHEINTENVGLTGWRKKWAIMRERSLVKKVDLMVCVSNAAADYFAERYGIERPTVITNCSLKTDRAVSDVKHDGFEVLNHGQYYAGRGYDIMVEAIPYLQDDPEIKLAMRGFGVLEDQLRARARELGEESVRFYPRVLVNELIESASHSHVGVAITEGICINFRMSVSNKLFEYASAGLPVIMSDIPEHRFLNDQYRFGVILEENTPRCFAEAVRKLKNDPELYRSCAENAVRLSEEINWENEFSRLLEAERKMMERA